MTSRFRLVACELRFRDPGGDWEEAVGLAVQRLRDSFPQVSEGDLGQLLLSSPESDWTIWLTAEAAGLETRAIRDFSALREHLAELTLAIKPRLTGGLARVGLRAVRAVPGDAPALPSSLGQVYSQERVIRGALGRFQYILHESMESDSGASFVDIDVATESVGRHTVADRVEEAYQAARQLAGLAPDGLAVGEPTSIGSSYERNSRAMAPTSVLAYPELLPPTGALRREPGPLLRELATDRAELLERKHFGSGLSAPETARLEVLDRRLEELLPPLPQEYLESLVRMAERTEAIHRRTRERRQHLDSE